MKKVLLAALSLVTTLPGFLSAADDYCYWQRGPSGQAANAIVEPLCGLSGNALSGRDVAMDKSRGNCLSCHSLPAPEHEFHGLIGPPLQGVASRYNEGELRMRLVDATYFNPDTIMPGFYRHPDNVYRLAEEYAGTTLLSAQQIEDLVAYLMTLKSDQ